MFKILLNGFIFVFSCQIWSDVEEAARESGGRGSIPPRDQQPAAQQRDARHHARDGRDARDAAGLVRLRIAATFVNRTRLRRVRINSLALFLNRTN